MRVGLDDPTHHQLTLNHKATSRSTTTTTTTTTATTTTTTTAATTNATIGLAPSWSGT